ncbi:MAG: hypothetical protein KGY45_02290 [Hadesarchaea archaeon]|nr:hypothetical protein [Hadesarchaea archaeon]
MTSRSVRKYLKDFAKRELKEKKAKEVHVRRVKMKSLMSRGKLPDMKIKGIKESRYLICVFHNNTLRIYQLNQNGEMMGANEFSGEEKNPVREEINKETEIMFKFSK